MLKKPNRDYFRIFLTVAGCILFYFILAHFSQVKAWAGSILRVFNPVLYGFIIAYLLNPIMSLFIGLFTKMRKKDKPTGGIRIAALILTYIVAILVVGAIGLIIVPQLIESINTLGKNFNGYVSSFSAWLRDLTNHLEGVIGSEFIQDSLEGLTSYLQDAAKSIGNIVYENLPGFANFLSGLTTAVGSFLFGMFLSIYMLFDKENLLARVKKTVYTLFRKGTATRVVLFCRETNETVGSFINGKILDSFIIGVMCYVVFLIFKIPFAGLFAVITGLFNIIPMFGPIIGAFINGFLLLIVSPNQLILFIILIIVIQQIDGNIIGPRILGKVTGLSGFWVMVALTVGSGLFGLWGMILAVPVFTVLYRGFGKLVNTSLDGSGMPSDTEYYFDFPPREEITEGVEKKKGSIFKKLFGKNKKLFGKKKKKKTEPYADVLAPAVPDDPAPDPGAEETEEDPSALAEEGGAEGPAEDTIHADV